MVALGRTGLNVGYLGGMPISEFLKRHHAALRSAVWSRSSDPVSGKVDTIVVRALATIIDPETGESLDLKRVAALSPETGWKGKIALRELLESERELLFESIPAPLEAKETPAVKTCFDTSIVWKGA